MRFAISVHGGPYTSQSSHSALNFARAVLAEGHELYRVFFYHDGVYNGSALMAPPQDEVDLYGQWHALAEAHDLDLVVCIASALRRGVLDATEAERYEKSASNLGNRFTISGLGQLIDAALSADRLVTFRV